MTNEVVFTDKMGTEIKEGDTVVHFHTGSKGHGAIIFAKALVLGFVEKDGMPYKVKILKNDGNSRNLSQIKPVNCIVTKSDMSLEQMFSDLQASKATVYPETKQV